MGWNGGRVNTNTLEDKFSDISYVDFYSRAITTHEDWGDGMVHEYTNEVACR